MSGTVASAADGGTVLGRPNSAVFGPAAAEPVLLTATVMAPPPWNCPLQVAVVLHQAQLKVVLSDFHARVLHQDGPMAVCAETLRSRLMRDQAGSQTTIDPEHHPCLFSALKRAKVLGNRSPRAKLVGLADLQCALTKCGADREDVARIMGLYSRVASEQLGRVDAAATAAAAAGAAVAAVVHGTHATFPAPVDATSAAARPAAGATTVATVAASHASPPGTHAVPPATQLAASAGHCSGSAPPCVPSTSRVAVAATATAAAAGAGPADASAAPAAVAAAQQELRPSAVVVGPEGVQNVLPGPGLAANFPRDWPMVIPDIFFAPHLLVRDYGLAVLLPDYEQHVGCPLGAELCELKQWMTTPIHVGRGTSYSRAVKEITWQHTRDSILGFMGYMFKVEGTSVDDLSTELLEQPWNTARYLGFLLARQVNSATITQQLGNLRKVLAWRASRGLPVGDYARLQMLLLWFDTLRRQCQSAGWPGRSPLQRMFLPHASQVMRWQLQVERAIDADIAADVQQYGHISRARVAIRSQDAALMAMLFGYLPPCRLYCVRTCQHPDCVRVGQCQEEECRDRRHCLGNRLEWVPGSDHTQLQLSFAHHKNESRWGHLPIAFTLPPSLTSRLMPWIKQGHKLVAPPGQPLLFVHEHRGTALTAPELSQWWAKLLARYEAPFKFPPSELRHIFVDERCGLDAVMGPDNRGAARIMGNSVERWALTYDRNLHVREVSRAAAAMEQWRLELVTLAQHQAPPPQTPPRA